MTIWRQFLLNESRSFGHSVSHRSPAAMFRGPRRTSEGRALRILSVALTAGALALAPSLAHAQTNGNKQDPAGAGATITDGTTTQTPKWVREPIGGPKSSKFLRVADTRGMGDTFAALVALGASRK